MSTWSDAAEALHRAVDEAGEVASASDNRDLAVEVEESAERAWWAVMYAWQVYRDLQRWQARRLAWGQRSSTETEVGRAYPDNAQGGSSVNIGDKRYGVDNGRMMIGTVVDVPGVGLGVSWGTEEHPLVNFSFGYATEDEARPVYRPCPRPACKPRAKRQWRYNPIEDGEPDWATGAY
jgi:hypothetical protein